MAMDLSGRSLVVGLGETGFSVANYLAGRGADFCVIDSREAPPKLAETTAARPEIEVHCGTTSPAWLDGVARVIVSPGLSQDLPLIREARRSGLSVINDIEIFAHAASAPIAAVTGSNGKSTVVTLLSQLLEAQGLSAPKGGNLGPPALDLLAAAEPDAYVLEISSFQMEAVESLRPRAAAVLNVSADHLDRHGTAARYAGLKEKLLELAELAVVSFDDPLVRAMGERHPHAIYVSVESNLPDGYCIVDIDGTSRLARRGIPVLACDELGMRGKHNVFNALAALALADAMTGNEVEAAATLRAFQGLAHRCETIAERAGVVYINDSKATNVGATIAALRGLSGPIVLIAGGDSKGADLTALVEHARGKLKTAIVLGRAAGELERLLGPLCPVARAAAMQEAVISAARAAEPGDTVLLSPACSSLDMFTDYKARGEAFARAVRGLPA